MWACKDLSLQT